MHTAHGFSKYSLERVIKELMAEEQESPYFPINEQDYISEQMDFEDEDEYLYDEQGEQHFTNVQEEALISNEQSSTFGVTYTRFGNLVCPIGSNLLYNGTLTGSRYGRRESGSRYLCLSQQRQYTSLSDGSKNTNPSTIFPARYIAPLRAEAQNQNVPCALCYRPNRSATITIQGKFTCPEPFEMEYEGYIMSARNGRRPSRYLCVDQELVTISNKVTNLKVRAQACTTCGPRLYHVRASNDNQKRELTCVVCSGPK